MTGERGAEGEKGRFLGKGTHAPSSQLCNASAPTFPLPWLGRLWAARRCVYRLPGAAVTRRHRQLGSFNIVQLESLRWVAYGGSPVERLPTRRSGYGDYGRARFAEESQTGATVAECIGLVTRLCRDRTVKARFDRSRVRHRISMLARASNADLAREAIVKG